MTSVSVVMSTYNRSGMLRLALSTALAQRDVDFELVVVDNGSTDDTSEVVRSFRDDRIRLTRNATSLGPTGGRNTGLKAADGDWVALLDDDDLWAPTKLSAQLAALTDTGRQWGYSGCVYIDCEGHLLGGAPPKSGDEAEQLLPTCYVVPAGVSSMIWRRGVLDQDGLLDPAFSYCTDWDVSLRLLRGGPPAVVPHPHVAYRLHGAKVSRHADQFVHEFGLIERKFADLRGDRPLDWAAHYRYVGSEALRAGDRWGAAVAYWQGLRLGDRSCAARLASVALPRPVRERIVRRVRGDAAWMAEAAQWLETTLRSDTPHGSVRASSNGRVADRTTRTAAGPGSP